MMNRGYDKTQVKTSNGLKIILEGPYLTPFSYALKRGRRGFTSACYITATIPTILCHYIFKWILFCSCNLYFVYT